MAEGVTIKVMNEAPSSDETKAPSNPPSPVVKILLAERERLLKEIERIDRFLCQEGFLSAAAGASETPLPTPSPVPSRNLFSKAQALKRALELATTPLTPREIVGEMKRLGYAFTSKNPANTLNPFLYGPRKLEFVKKVERGFILAKREEEFENLMKSNLAAQPFRNDVQTAPQAEG